MASQSLDEEIVFGPAAPPRIIIVEQTWQLLPRERFVEVRFPFASGGDINITIDAFRSNTSVDYEEFMKTHGIESLNPTTCRFRQSQNQPDNETLLIELIHWGIGSPTWSKPDQKDRMRPERLHLLGMIIYVCEWDDRRQVRASAASSVTQTSQDFRTSPRSDGSSAATFFTASSLASYMSARSTNDSRAFSEASALRYKTIVEVDERHLPEQRGPLEKLRYGYGNELRQRKLIQSFDKELNWSGRGQHVVFEPKEHVPLEFIAHLGATATARVEMVRCRRVALARKTMRCKGSWDQSNVLQEVSHLQNLRHSHIVQLVGTYLQGRDFSLLMYPAADCHLGIFLEDTEDMRVSVEASVFLNYWVRRVFLADSMYCLASAVECVHKNSTRHMDIKPQNVLVRRVENSPLWTENSPPWMRWRIYLADFGLSRSFANQDHSQTDGPTSLTPKYCAPEVYEYDSRGRSSDIFSLGCVYTEMMTVIGGTDGRSLSDFAEFRRNEEDDTAFHKNLEKVIEWITKDKERWGSQQVVLSMLHVDPLQRPVASDVMRLLKKFRYFRGLQANRCCNEGPEPYVVYNGP